MPTLEELLAEISSPTSPQGNIALEELMQPRPGALSRFGTQALGRAEDIANVFLPEAYEVDWASPESLPEAQGFTEKAADVVGSFAPDLAVAAATAPLATGVAGAAGVAKLASPFLRALATEGIHSALLAPIEYGTRDPISATAATIGAPVAAAGAGALLGKLFGRVSRGAAAEASSPQNLLPDPRKMLGSGPIQQPSGKVPLRLPPGEAPISDAAAAQSIGELDPFQVAENIAAGDVLDRLPLAVRAELPPGALPDEVDVSVPLLGPGKQPGRELLALPSGPIQLPSGKVPKRLAAGDDIAKAALDRQVAREQIITSIVLRKPIPTAQFLALDDGTLSEVAKTTQVAMMKAAVRRLNDPTVGASKAALESLEEAGLNLPPRVVKEIENALDGLAPDEAERFAARMKGKGTCPL